MVFKSSGDRVDVVIGQILAEPFFGLALEAIEFVLFCIYSGFTENLIGPNAELFNMVQELNHELLIVI